MPLHFAAFDCNCSAFRNRGFNLPAIPFAPCPATTSRAKRGREPALGPLAIMTRSDYHMTMTGIRIADLKSRLSEHLRKVRRGSSLTILDRDTPIARIVPWKAGNGSLKLRAPVPGAPKLQRVPLPPPLHLRGDIVKLLLEERQRDR